MNNKVSKHPRYDDPSAFKKRFPRIERVGGVTTAAAKLLTVNEQHFKMGSIRAGLIVPGGAAPGYFLSVHGRDRYPTWDEIVWLRYNLIPDAAVMALLLPNLDSYINHEGTAHKFVFTLEQKGWALAPEPRCEICGGVAHNVETAGTLGVFVCLRDCDVRFTIDMATWNEQHGSGLLTKR